MSLGQGATLEALKRESRMAKKFPIIPLHPERVCWGCDKYCPADSLACGNGSERTQHPSELFGADWMEWESPQLKSNTGCSSGAVEVEREKAASP